MFKKIINFDQTYYLQFDFSKKNPRRFYQKNLSQLYQKIFNDLKKYFNQENIEIFLISEDLIWESLKNAYNACLDKYLQQGDKDYFVKIQYNYQNDKFELSIIDNGIGLKATSSQQKNKKKNLYLGGQGKGMSILLNRITEYQKEHKHLCKVDYFFSPSGKGAIVNFTFDPKQKSTSIN